MDKERKPIVTDEDGFSEKALDIAVDTGLANDQVKGKGGSIFDPQKKKVSKVPKVSKVSRGESD
ncbi:MAG: hypothetical protein HY426_00390 [Candidatus Levybacteria bacterium]|nr:hypothetical protein [Candidatus Levybacteria bacterium]